MLNDVTFGQYYPTQSFVHRMDPRAKIVLVIAYIVAIFLANNFFGLAAVTLFLIIAVAFSRVPVGSVLRSVKMILFIIIFTAILNLFFYSSSSDLHILAQWWVITISWESIINMIFLAMRLFLLVLGTSVLTLTTSPVALTDGIESLLTPLKWIRFPVHELAMMMTIALRFIPTLIEETDKIMSAQKARGADFESGGLMDKAKSLVPIMVPLFVSSFRRADELALAMECRCYHGGAGRTRMRQLKYQGVDYAGFAVSLLVLAAVVAVNAYFPSIY